MSNVKETVEAVQGIVEAVPVYDDMLQPAAKELSSGLLTVAKTINIALAPLSALVWSYEKVKDRFMPRLEEKLKNVPEENIVTPEPSIAVPVIEALRYTGHNNELCEMFSSLLASAMDRTTAPKAHPSFVEIIRQINSDEAKIINLLDKSNSMPIIKIRLYDKNSAENGFAEPLVSFSNLPYAANCSYPDLGQSYLENLERLGIINLSYSVYCTVPSAYIPIENHPIIDAWRKQSTKVDKRFEIIRGALTLTAFGRKFIETCVTFW
ncbi:DUF4393 domain-containing protein [Bacillus sp. 1NLA3E]|uniref:DUF4393 domain-containing protein n=1 Tax=Bacillus sp. 1NLA3E TaxID=666686 RepID=UPI000247F415|nr:DUF4393 domain-containing protein [Bacillus sp. 1NLA3E]AGK52059.1 hypothetical protein B1NLA3E_01375 [Bacillus sp. 1NLA3E]